MLSIFLCTYWPCICLLCRNIYLGLLPIFRLGFLCFCYWVVWVVCIFWRLIPFWLHCLQIFSLFCRLSFFFFGCFWVFTWGIWRFLGQGLNQSCSCWPTPQLQQLEILAASVTNMTANGNAGSLTHWARPGIEPVSSWILVEFITTEPQWEFP